ncbi:ferritin-like domain-containing protein [uncultured Brevundimonas sp.]|uniref:ferritin-like domain-containing protein n=1 Tax=uncultured Brevundimonas sp. TaxID=213418 RepID=UPI002603CC5D|nr:ferritin-like domain-containing protein [uncultured Brevundimonas sp.]
MNNDHIWRDVFVSGLKNAHAVEHQALALMDRQIERAKSFTEVANMLKSHRTETEQQIERLEQLLEGFDEKPSTIKDTALSLSGNMAALGHMFADDEILKNSFANFAFENFEVASYRGLILLARHGEYSAAYDPLNASLDEEMRMASWVDQSLPMITEKFLALKRSDAEHSR